MKFRVVLSLTQVFQEVVEIEVDTLEEAKKKAEALEDSLEFRDICDSHAEVLEIIDLVSGEQLYHIDN